MKTLKIAELLFLILLGCNGMFAQGVSINMTGTEPDPSAILDVSSETQGILIPRMTTAQRDAISTPAQSLLIFNSTDNCLQLYNNPEARWENIYCMGNCNPLITTHPVNTECCENGNANFNVIATGTGLSYQWQENVGSSWVDLSDGGIYSDVTTSTLNLTNVNSGIDGYKYRCVVSGSCEPYATSNEAELSIFIQPGDPTAGTHVPGEYQIEWNWNSVSGATGYKYNTVDEYSTAIDNGSSTAYTQTSLDCETAYTLYVWAYNNYCNPSGSTSLNETTSLCPPCGGLTSVTDYDGNNYSTVEIGDQCWMGANLNVTHDPEGNSITRYCYNNNSANCNTYGGLYTWSTIMDGATSTNANPSGVQGICPDGWHVPSVSEWSELENYLTSNGFPSVEAIAIKSTSGWDSGGNGTDNFSFTGLPAGYGGSTTTFSFLGQRAAWFTTVENEAVRLFYNSNVIEYYVLPAGYKPGLRCVKD